MVSINYSSREVCCKIVYYGPGLSGKTTNLQYVHTKVPSNTRGKLISLATEADRTLYFDFLPINIGTINGFAAKFQLYTVPGQVYYNATRKLVLRGVDGVVFVADSQPDKMEENIESLINLEENLKEYGYDIDDLPVVIQYNKRDLPGVLPVEQLNAKLNQRGWRSFEASATLGNGVFDTLKLIIKLVLDKAKSSSTPRPTPVAAAEPAAVGASVPTGPTAEPLAAPPAPAAGAALAQATVSRAPAVTAEPREQTVSAGNEPPAKPVSRQERPYPGSHEPEARDKKISATTFTPVRRDEEPPESIDKVNKMGPGSASDEEVAPRQITPGMAPGLRRRGQTKKRSFFKRLFGIK